MSEKPKLKVVKKLPEARNYWNTCPKAMKKCCELNSPEEDEETCPWWINSEKHDYCFWSFVLEHSDDQGSMPALTQSDLAKLFNWSNTKTHFILKEAMEELTDALKLYHAVELLENADSDELEEILVGNLESDYSEELD